MFLANFPHNVDAKGRVSLPADFRDVVGGDRVIIWPSFLPGEKFNYLVGAGTQHVADYMARFRQGSKSRRLAAHCVASNSRPLGFDSTGRILLPKTFMAHAGITGQALFVGVFDNFQVWNPDTYAQFKAGLETEMQDNPEQLPDLGQGLAEIGLDHDREDAA